MSSFVLHSIFSDPSSFTSFLTIDGSQLLSFNNDWGFICLPLVHLKVIKWCLGIPPIPNWLTIFLDESTTTAVERSNKATSIALQRSNEYSWNEATRTAGTKQRSNEYWTALGNNKSTTNKSFLKQVFREHGSVLFVRWAWSDFDNSRHVWPLSSVCIFQIQTKLRDLSILSAHQDRPRSSCCVMVQSKYEGISTNSLCMSKKLKTEMYYHFCLFPSSRPRIFTHLYSSEYGKPCLN